MAAVVGLVAALALGLGRLRVGAPAPVEAPA